MIRRLAAVLTLLREAQPSTIMLTDPAFLDAFARGFSPSDPIFGQARALYYALDTAPLSDDQELAREAYDRRYGFSRIAAAEARRSRRARPSRRRK